jgi:glycosyltransferase involved in cell wall biosynthesis
MIDPAGPSLCSNDNRRPRIVLAHDWVVARRGGELVLDAIACALAPRADLVALLTMFHAGVGIGPAIDTLPVTTSALNALPRGARRWVLPLYPAATAQLSRRLASLHAARPIDLLVSTSSVAAKSVRTPPGVPHLCYCHTPARYLWSQGANYRAGGVKGLARSAGLTLFRNPLRRWDRTTARGVTAFLANSTHTRDQIRRVWDRDAMVLHPPVRTDFFTLDPGTERDGSLLVVSALEPYKKVELAIEAAAIAGRRLVVIGTGSHAGALREHARRVPGAQIEFRGAADDAVVRDAMRRAAAFLMPQTEDFGITAVEAQACGMPVIARAAGGALDSVLQGVTGVLVEDPTPSSLADAIEKIPPNCGGACRSHAEGFGPERFAEVFLDHVDRFLPGRF